MTEEMVRVGTYSDFKAAMDQEVRNVTQGFVRMGYLLKVARDTDILAESGYKTVAEFAAAEYGMNETYVSRFIGINDRYSEDGYSDHLQEKYQGYGMSLLAEMLTLPESIADAIPQGVTRQEIREIKREYEAEQKITPMEVMLEGQQAGVEHCRHHARKSHCTLVRHICFLNRATGISSISRYLATVRRAMQYPLELSMFISVSSVRGCRLSSSSMHF